MKTWCVKDTDGLPLHDIQLLDVMREMHALYGEDPMSAADIHEHMMRGGAKTRELMVAAVKAMDCMPTVAEFSAWLANKSWRSVLGYTLNRTPGPNHVKYLVTKND